MKTIVAGSRSINDYRMVQKIIRKCPFDITQIVCGCAEGVDKLGSVYADKYDIPIKYFPANWGKYGKRAGMIRNTEMAMYADALILIWDGISKGSQHMLDCAKKKNLVIFEKVI